MKNSIFTILLCILFLFNSCTNKPKTKKKSIKKIMNAQKKDNYLEISQNFLTKYSKYYNEKNTDKILKLYSKIYKVNLLSKEGLNEIFELYDSIQIKYKNIRIKSHLKKKIIFECVLNYIYKINEKEINDNKIVKISLSFDGKNYKLDNIVTLKIIP